MKTNRLLATALVSAVLASCSQDEVLKFSNDAPAVYTGTMEETKSRVLLEQDYTLSWEMGDELSIFPKFDLNNQYRVVSKDGKYATFEYVDYVEKEGYVTIGNTYAVYPYYAENELNGEVITTEVPSVIDYVDMENSIKHALISSKSNESNLYFTNAQGILRLKLNAVTPFKYGAISSITLTSNENLLSGTAKIDYSNSDTPEAVITEGESFLTINLAEALQKDLPSAKSDNWETFYIPVVPTQFDKEDLTLTIVGRNGETFNRPVRLAFGIERKKIYTLYVTLDENPTYTGELEGAEDAVFVANLTELQRAIDNAVAGENVINIGADITGNAVVTQKPDVNITIVGQGFDFNGMITVDGKSGTYTTAGLTIKDLNFAAETISGDACIRLGDGTNATRYTCNVTVEGCTFDVPGAVGIKSYTGGDKNLTIKDCTATEKAHSLIQAKGIDGILIEGCTINSKNGMNFNNSNNVTIEDCTANVRGYAARFGEGSAATGAEETYSIKNSTLESACEETGDAVIILRGTADNSILNIENTTLKGALKIVNKATNVTVNIDGNAIMTTLAELQAMINNGATEITLNADIMGTLVMKSGVTINGNGYQLGSVNLNGADNVTLKNITFDAANAVLGYDNKNAAKQYANIITGDNTNKQNKGSHNLMIEGCTFTGTFANGGTSIAFTDYYRTSGFSGNITIKGCTFDTKNAYYSIYGYYTGNGTNGYGDFVIEGNTFKTTFTQGGTIYLGRYASSTPVVVKDNTFETVSSLEEAIFVQDHSNYGVSIDASDNNFAQ